MLTDSIEITDGDIKSGVIESGSQFPGVGNTRTRKKGQLYYLDTAVNGKASGLYVYDGAAWNPSSGAEGSAGESVDESELWMGA